MGRGIDYGYGKLNIDLKTGIRFGVINVNMLAEGGDGFEPEYGDPCCQKCGGEVAPTGDTDADGICQDTYWCGDCKQEWSGDECVPDMPICHVLDADGYQAQFGEDGDIFVMLSNWVTRAAFCSPCAPGACHLMSPCEDGELTYCLGPEWFDNESPMPYVPINLPELRSAHQEAVMKRKN